ncbi:hypothetical protein BN14_03755 [Rhizoctonia solani AG-1 IB]|uniref:Uncharacterized protein n=1 Tax=Thanatephorus cucumeris (strain AG1-IB / isolate 7/3/14) TaxID=1108050 RepID=M5BRC6_THACB|nr:hypothetical protein BN14_03755 [Rhizoctonia solani AG-1 IB]
MASTTEIKFHLSPSSGVTISDISVQGKLKSIPDHKLLGSIRITPEAITADLVPLSKQTPPLPWGLEDEVTWTFSFSVSGGSTEHALSITHQLELYAVSGYADSYKTRPMHQHGMPRDALHFYLIHARKVYNNSIEGIADYVRSIVNVVHWCSGFAYDTGFGTTQFSAKGMDKDHAWFNVRRWASLLRPGSPKEPISPDSTVHTVNCYDQAAAVWTGIALALANQGDTNKLVWHYAEPFGFIQPTHLVGWGDETKKTTNPYFSANLEKQGLTGDNELRFGYWNHAFIEFDKKVLDATCGPHTGDEDLADYLKKSIDYPAGKPGGSLNTAWADHVKKDATDSEKKQIDDFGGATAEFVASEEGKGGVYELKDSTGNLISTESYTGRLGVVDLVYGHNLAYMENPSNSRKRVSRSLDHLGISATKEPNYSISVQLLQELSSAIQGFMKGNDPSSFTAQGSFAPKFHILYFSKDFCHFSWKALASSSEALSIDLYILSDSKQATNMFAILADPPASSKPGPLFQRVGGDSTERKIVGKEGTSGPGNLIRATGNIVFVIKGRNSNKELEPIEKLLVDLLGEPQDGSAPGELVVKDANNIEDVVQDGIQCVQGEKFSVIASADNGYMLRCNLQDYWFP